MLSRRALLSGKETPNTVTIPLLGSFKASNGAEPSVNTGCTLEAEGLYIPKRYVEYKISDLYPKPWSKITLELDLMYTNTAETHGYFDFFDTRSEHFVGVEYNMLVREHLFLYDVYTESAIPKNTYIHVIVSADFAQGDTIPHGEIVGLSTKAYPLLRHSIGKPSAIWLGHYYTKALHDGWQGYARNVKVTFE